MNRKLSIAFAAALLSAPILAGTASATEEVCVPQEAVTETVVVVDVPAIEAVYNLVWHQYTGNSESTPSLDDENWKASPALPEGKKHQDREVGVPYQTNPNGNGNWFLYLEVLVTPAVEAVTHTEVRIVTPAVECPEPTPEVPLPTPVTLPELPPITPPGGPNDNGEVCCAIDKQDPDTEVGDGGVFRPAAPKTLPHTGTDDAVYIALAAFGLIGLGYVAYTFGKRP